MEHAWYYVVGPTSVEEVREAFNGVTIVEEQGIFWVFVEMGHEMKVANDIKIHGS